MQLINNGKTPEGIIFSDLGNLCEPRANISSEFLCDKWTCLDYETAAICGTLLTAFETASPQPVTLNPQLSGWYKIYVGLVDNPANRVFLKLSSDEVQSAVKTSDETYPWSMMKWDRFQEPFWKCADMTGQTIEIARRSGYGTVSCHVGWFRFVPMTEEEIAEWKHDEVRTDTKRMLATHDMFSVVVANAPRTITEWCTEVEKLRYSDVKIFSLEANYSEDGTVADIDPRFSFYSEERRYLHENLVKKTRSVYEGMIEYGHKCGLEMYLGKRMGASLGSAFPYDNEYTEKEFGEANKHLRCKDRDGEWIEAMSLAYPEVQNQVISEFLKLAEFDCDGVTLIYVRGIPYVLFEDPVIERFKVKYPDINPCELPLADERLYGIHCEIMNEFMRKLKNSLNEKCKELGRRPIKILAYIGNSILDNKHIGLDIETWAKEGLVDSFSAYPIWTVERLDGLMQDDNPELIDLEKYSRAVRESYHKVVHRDIEGDFDEGYYKPKSTIDPEFVEEYVALAEKYGIEAYFDIFDRQKPSQDYIKEALKLMEHGAERFSLWDVDCRAETLSEWEAASRLGHLDELKNGTLIKNPSSVYRILKINGKSISIYNPSWMG